MHYRTFFLFRNHGQGYDPAPMIDAKTDKAKAGGEGATSNGSSNLSLTMTQTNGINEAQEKLSERELEPMSRSGASTHTRITDQI